MADRTLNVRITGDPESLAKAFRKVGKEAEQLDKSGLGKLKRGFGALNKVALVSLGAIGVGAAGSIKAASDLGEQISKSSAVFKASAPQIQAWAKTTASSIGISQRAALEAAGTLGNLLVPMGLARPKAAQMSQSMVKLAADMASFNNASPEETLEALRSGLTGEAEPLRRFGVLLSDARMKQEAVNLGLVKGKQELTEAQKAQVRYSLILKDTADAQGDFGRTSDSLANRQRILRAQVEDLGAKFGQALVPAATAAANVLGKVADWASKNATTVKVLTVGVGGLAAVVVTVNAGLKAYNATTAAGAVIRSLFIRQTAAQATATGAAAASQTGLNVAMRANPIGIVVTALALLAAGLVLAWRRSETFRRIVKGAFDVVKRAVELAIAPILAVRDALSAIGDLIDSIVGKGPSAAQTAAATGAVARNVTGTPRKTTTTPGGKPFGTRAMGGVVRRPEIALIGEAGAEAVIPLTRPRRAAQVLAEAGLLRPFAKGGVVGGPDRSGGARDPLGLARIGAAAVAAGDPFGFTRIGAAAVAAGAKAVKSATAVTKAVKAAPAPPELPTERDFLEAAAAMAALTDGLADDIAAADSLEAFAKRELQAAQASGDPRRIREAAGNLVAARGTLADLGEKVAALTTALTGNTEAAAANTDATEKAAETMQKFGGAIAFSFRGQEYVLGRIGPSSERLVDAGVGI